MTDLQRDSNGINDQTAGDRVLDNPKRRRLSLN